MCGWSNGKCVCVCGSNKNASWTGRMSILISLHNYVRSLAHVLAHKQAETHKHTPTESFWPPHKVTNSLYVPDIFLPNLPIKRDSFYEDLTTFWYKFACLHMCVAAGCSMLFSKGIPLYVAAFGIWRGVRFIGGLYRGLSYNPCQSYEHFIMLGLSAQ